MDAVDSIISIIKQRWTKDGLCIYFMHDNNKVDIVVGSLNNDLVATVCTIWSGYDLTYEGSIDTPTFRSIVKEMKPSKIYVTTVSDINKRIKPDIVILDW